MNTLPSIQWPDDKSFAFTIFDDTDFSTVENVGPVYEFLTDLGMRTTKSVWPFKGSDVPRVGGSTCEDAEYLRWVKSLQSRGFEIGYHGATFHTSPRATTIRAIDRFKELFGHYPHSMANHTGCQEGIYWGFDRLSGFKKTLYRAILKWRGHDAFRGHVENDPLFWGDVCRSKLNYVRNFQFSNINTLAECPNMPYHDPIRPYVNQWFASSEGAEVEAFNRCVSETNQDQLEAEGGACIMYTHLACGFYENGSLQPEFERLITRLASKNGWFVPTHQLLDHLAHVRGPHTLTSRERRALELSWLKGKFLTGPS